MAESVPSLPTTLSGSALYVGKIVIQQGATDGTAYSRDWGASVVNQITTDHGDLSGLADDDHVQYHNDTRGDVRYLYKENTTEFIPDGDYEPATKKYVDDSIITGSSPLTTKGDLYTFNTDNARLAVGTDGYYLVADSGETTGLRYIGENTELAFACSDETSDLTTGEKISIDMPYDMTITRVYASVTTAPVGSTLQIDVEDEGVSILNAVLSIAVSTNNAETSSFSGATTSYSMSKGDLLTIDIDQIGTTTAGAGLVVHLVGVKTV